MSHSNIKADNNGNYIITYRDVTVKIIDYEKKICNLWISNEYLDILVETAKYEFDKLGHMIIHYDITDIYSMCNISVGTLTIPINIGNFML